jgi:hypothetical protein
MRDRQEVMGLLGGKGGPRSWEIEVFFVDLLGPVESFARTPFRKVEAPYGPVLVMKPEDLLVERVLVSFYPGTNQAARDCVKKLVALILRDAIAVDWQEVARLANLREYRNFSECDSLVQEVADELKTKNPLHSD